MATVRIDSLGTTLTRGVFLNRHDTIVRQAFLSNEGEQNIFDNTVGDYSRAVNAYIAEVGLFYPLVYELDDTNQKFPIGPVNLPLLKIRAQRFGPTKMLVTAIYQRSPGSDIPDDPAANANVRSFEDATRVYRTTVKTNNAGEITETNVLIDGLPGGDFIDPLAKLNDESQKPDENKWWPISGSIVTLLFHTIGLPDIQGLESFKGRINDDPVLFLGYFFTAHTIKFNGYELDTSGDGGFDAKLEFHIVAPGWLEQMVVANRIEDPNDPDNTIFDKWATATVPSHETKNFKNFPDI